ncbi:hypothetical protein Btru_008650 [Bulinus truncatus]|nr:hypothetical protein Btru_008650 [Bulinus truncatus]
MKVQVDLRLLKAKKYDWTDSNMALFGSDTEKQVKKEPAATEPAWIGAGSSPGLRIWRIEQFQVKNWVKEDYGEFYKWGFVYCSLIHIKTKTVTTFSMMLISGLEKNKFPKVKDEYGTAAYKTVELDTYLDDVPVQHRECQGHESSLFKSYFPQGINTMEGGTASGFRHVTPETYEPRLFKFSTDKDGRVAVREYNGEESSARERSKAMRYIGNIKSQRGEAVSGVLDGGSVPKSHEFWQKLDQDLDNLDDDDVDGVEDKKLLRVNTETAQSDLVKEGDFSLDVFICDSGETVFVWVGGNASSAEKRNGLPYAHNYLRGSGRPWRPITVVKEGLLVVFGLYYYHFYIHIFLNYFLVNLSINIYIQKLTFVF